MTDLPSLLGLSADAAGPIPWALGITFVLLALGAVFCFLRLLLGPSLADRVLALDLIATLAIAFAAGFSIRAGDIAYLDVAAAFALIAFLSTVAFARYAERRHDDRTDAHLTEPRGGPASDAKGRRAPPPEDVRREADP